MPGSFSVLLMSVIFSKNITDEITFSLTQREATVNNLNVAKKKKKNRISFILLIVSRKEKYGRESFRGNSAVEGGPENTH